ncbi:cilia- and flagella-associated protein 99-like [Pollicipes pollicipes]|uniref:cilia- and flagella-associated protein 99-like n=1 Tax=Pollicipes pollicipes TaxID=41117 RepID=UPI0018851F84|nr:cilia- and flagella-associated protein 99-like [Pollicipes pollicipes]
MSERGNGGSSKAKKSKPASSNAANSGKVSTRAPARVTTVQKLHLRLFQVGIGNDRSGRADASKDAASNLPNKTASSGEDNSRDSSPGIDSVPPPSEPPLEPTPPPPVKKQVKRTAAQILRELARCKAEQQQEIKRISALEFVAVPEEVVNRKAIELEEQDSLSRAERRMLALLSLENSIASKDKALDQKKKLGHKTVEEKRSLRRLLAKLRQQEQLIATQVRDAVHNMRQRARQAVAAAAERKAAQAKQFGEETLSMVREAQKQQEEERQQKSALIQEIRQLESVSQPHVKQLDLTETAGHGLLDEMSIAELRERIDLLNMQRSAKLREKNERILNQRRIQEAHMEMAEEILTRFHETQARERRERRGRPAQQPPPVTSARLEELQLELEQKRAERLQRAARRRVERCQQRFLASTKAAPPAVAVRSAPTAVGRQVAPTEARRRHQSDSCLQLGMETRRFDTLRSDSGFRREFV